MTKRRDSKIDPYPPDPAALPRWDVPPRVTRGDARSVSCLYCAAAIPASAFVYWTRKTRLLSADCPECTRRTTLAVRGLGPLLLPAERGITVVLSRSTLELVDAHPAG